MLLVLFAFLKPLSHPEDLVKMHPPMTFPLKGPEDNNTIPYSMDLNSLPADLAASCCKVRVWFGSEAAHHETYLAAENQLHQEHGTTFFKYVAGLNMASRPGPAKETTPRPPTLEKLQQEHDLAESKKAANPKSKVAAKNVAAEDEPSDEIDFGDQQDDDQAAQKVGVGQGSLQKQKKSAAEKKMEKTLAAAAAKKRKRDRDQDADAGSVRSSTKKPGTTNKDDSDDEMSLIIEAHVRADELRRSLWKPLFQSSSCLDAWTIPRASQQL